MENAVTSEDEKLVYYSVTSILWLNTTFEIALCHHFCNIAFRSLCETSALLLMVVWLVATTG